MNRSLQELLCLTRARAETVYPEDFNHFTNLKFFNEVIQIAFGCLSKKYSSRIRFNPFHDNN